MASRLMELSNGQRVVIEFIRMYRDDTYGFTGYEFKTSKALEIEPGVEYDCFRLSIRDNGEIDVYTTNEYAQSEDEGYVVFDDASFLFDLAELGEFAKSEARDNNIHDEQREYDRMKYEAEDSDDEDTFTTNCGDCKKDFTASVKEPVSDPMYCDPCWDIRRAKSAGVENTDCFTCIEMHKAGFSADDANDYHTGTLDMFSFDREGQTKIIHILSREADEDNDGRDIVADRMLLNSRLTKEYDEMLENRDKQINPHTADIDLGFEQSAPYAEMENWQWVLANVNEMPHLFPGDTTDIERRIRTTAEMRIEWLQEQFPKLENYTEVYNQDKALVNLTSEARELAARAHYLQDIAQFCNAWPGFQLDNGEIPIKREQVGTVLRTLYAYKAEHGQMQCDGFDHGDSDTQEVTWEMYVEWMQGDGEIPEHHERFILV